MDYYNDYQESAISKHDKEFAQMFENFVNGRMRSAEDTGMVLSTAHRYLQQMFKVFIGFMRQLAHNYQKGYYDDRNEWASRLAAEAYITLVEKELVYDPDYEASLWIGKDGHGLRGAPYHIMDIVADMEKAEEMVYGLLEAIREIV